MRVMVSPAVCPRLFEFLTTLTLGAQRRHHIVSTAFETIAKKKSKGRLVFLIRSAIYHELLRTPPKLGGKCVSVGVDALGVV